MVKISSRICLKKKKEHGKQYRQKNVSEENKQKKKEYKKEYLKEYRKNQSNHQSTLKKIKEKDKSKSVEVHVVIKFIKDEAEGFLTMMMLC